MAEHLTDEQLLLACDGEAGAEAEQHLAACAECDARLTDLRDGVALYGEFRHEALRKSYPAPPRPWRDLSFSHQKRRMGPMLGWMAAAAAVLIAVLLWPARKPSLLPTVGELLSRAETAERPAERTRRIRIRSSRGVTVRPAVWIREKGAEHPLQSMFRRAGYSWDEPLSVRSYNAWRRSLGRKTESVTRARFGQTSEPVYVVKTETDTSSLREATVRLRELDLKPVGGTLRFTDEVVEIEEDTTVADAAPSLASAPAKPEKAASAMQELEVIAALHNIGADLGEPVQIVREGQSVIVTAPSISPSRRAQIQSALATLDYVELRFEAPQAAPPGATRRPASIDQNANPGIRRLVEQRLQGRRSFDEFVNEALDASDALLSRTHALASLANRFPEAVEQSLPPSGRESLQAIRRNHMTAADENLGRLAALLASGLEITPGAMKAPFDTWQTRATALRDRSRAFDTLLTGMLTGAREYDSHSLQEAFAHLRSEFESLR